MKTPVPIYLRRCREPESNSGPTMPWIMVFSWAAIVLSGCALIVMGCFGVIKPIIAHAKKVEAERQVNIANLKAGLAKAVLEFQEAQVRDQKIQDESWELWKEQRKVEDFRDFYESVKETHLDADLEFPQERKGAFLQGARDAQRLRRGWRERIKYY